MPKKETEQQDIESSSNKKVLKTVYDEDVFIKIKTILFKNGISVQSFIGYIFSRMILNDEKILSLVKEAKQNMIETKKVTNEDKKFLREINEDYLYDMITNERKSDDEKNN